MRDRHRQRWNRRAAGFTDRDAWHDIRPPTSARRYDQLLVEVQIAGAEGKIQKIADRALLAGMTLAVSNAPVPVDSHLFEEVKMEQAPVRISAEPSATSGPESRAPNGRPLSPR